MSELYSLVTNKSAVIAAVLILIFIAESFYPVVKTTAGLMRIARNIGLAFVNFVLSPLIVVPLGAYVASDALQWRSANLSGGWYLFVDVLVLDFWIYWWHRFNHLIPFLWRWHVVHHLDETLDSTSAIRFHFGEVLLSALARSVVIWLLAIPLQSVVVFEVLLAVAAIFHHSNLSLPTKLELFISRLVVTPSIHWVHHHAIRRDTDSNYGTILSVWDRLFRSRSTTTRSAEMPIGVEGERDDSMLRLIVRPFGLK